MIDVSKVPLSMARRAGDFLYLSGQVALDASGSLVGTDIESQTRQVFANISRVLQENGAELDDVVSANVYLTDPANFAKYNEVYGSYFAKPPPARTTVICGLLMGALIEITVVAYLGEA